MLYTITKNNEKILCCHNIKSEIIACLNVLEKARIEEIKEIDKKIQKLYKKTAKEYDFELDEFIEDDLFISFADDEDWEKYELLEEKKEKLENIKYDFVEENK